MYVLILKTDFIRKFICISYYQNDPHSIYSCQSEYNQILIVNIIFVATFCFLFQDFIKNWAKYTWFWTQAVWWLFESFNWRFRYFSFNAESNKCVKCHTVPCVVILQWIMGFSINVMKKLGNLINSSNLVKSTVHELRWI